MLENKSAKCNFVYHTYIEIKWKTCASFDCLSGYVVCNVYSLYKIYDELYSMEISMRRSL